MKPSTVGVLVFCTVLSGCAATVVRTDGTVYQFACGNAATSYCTVPTPTAVEESRDRPAFAMGLPEPAPVQPPIDPKVRAGCTITQGGAEAGSTWGTILGVIGGTLMGLFAGGVL